MHCIPLSVIWKLNWLRTLFKRWFIWFVNNLPIDRKMSDLFSTGYAFNTDITDIEIEFSTMLDWQSMTIWNRCMFTIQINHFAWIVLISFHLTEECDRTKKNHHWKVEKRVNSFKLIKSCASQPLRVSFSRISFEWRHDSRDYQVWVRRFFAHLLMKNWMTRKKNSIAKCETDKMITLEMNPNEIALDL